MNYFKEKAIPHPSLVDFVAGLNRRICYSSSNTPNTRKEHYKIGLTLSSIGSITATSVSANALLNHKILNAYFCLQTAMYDIIKAYITGSSSLLCLCQNNYCYRSNEPSLIHQGSP